MGDDGRRRAVNDGGGNVQQTMVGTSGSVGEHQDPGEREYYYFMVSM